MKGVSSKRVSTFVDVNNELDNIRGLLNKIPDTITSKTQTFIQKAAFDVVTLDFSDTTFKIVCEEKGTYDIKCFVNVYNDNNSDVTILRMTVNGVNTEGDIAYIQNPSTTGVIPFTLLNWDISLKQYDTVCLQAKYVSTYTKFLFDSNSVGTMKIRKRS